MEFILTVEKTMTVTEAADALGVSRASIHKWIDGNRITALNISGLVLIPVSEIDRIKKEREKENGQNSI